MSKILSPFLLIFMAFSMSMPFALAEDPNDSFDVKEILRIDEGDAGDTNITEDFIEGAKDENVSPAAYVILRAINYLSLFVGTLAFVTIVIGGFAMITSGGDQNRIDKAKGIVNQSIYGLVIAFLSYFIVTFVISIFY